MDPRPGKPWGSSRAPTSTNWRRSPQRFLQNPFHCPRSWAHASNRLTLHKLVLYWVKMKRLRTEITTSVKKERTERTKARKEDITKARTRNRTTENTRGRQDSLMGCQGPGKARGNARGSKDGGGVPEALVRPFPSRLGPWISPAPFSGSPGNPSSYP